MSQLKYRPDIDGLRAIAVLSVVIFHFFPSSLPGGFVGVDVFFVISGYLISSIIFSDLYKHNFSFLTFYKKRINRIFPSLILLLFIVACLGWIYLTPVEFQNLGKHILSGSVFISNITFYHEINYFDRSSELKPLLHLWSLGIEEQFYLIWPALLFFIWKKLPKYLFLFIIVLFLYSLISNFLQINKDTSKAFFLLQYRGWELLAGALLALAENRQYYLIKLLKDNNIVSTFGLILLLTSIAVLDGTYRFPGYWAMLPVISTALIIAAGSNTWISKNILADKKIVYIGLISYPLYLWHWPLASFSYILENEHPSTLSSAILLAMSFSLASITFHFIEKPIKNLKESSKNLLSYTLLALLFTTAICGYMAYSVKNITSYIGIFGPESIHHISATNKDWDYPGRLNTRKDKSNLMNFREQGSGEKVIVFIGDSHAEQYYPKVENLIKNNENYKIQFFTHGGCPPIDEVSNGKTELSKCASHVKNSYLEAEAPNVNTVVITASWYAYFASNTPYYINDSSLKLSSNEGRRLALSNLTAHIQKLTTLGKKVFLILGIPSGQQFDPAQMITRSYLTLPKVNINDFDLTLFQQEFASIKQEFLKIELNKNALVIDPIESLCKNNICKTATEDGVPFYKDTDHFRPFYVKEYVHYLDQVFQ